MKRIYVNEKWCLGCHLCEYECAFANSGLTDMVRALKGKTIQVSKLETPLALTQVFPNLFEGKRGVNVKV